MYTVRCVSTLQYLLDWLGIHRFYVGKYGTGFIWLLTAGIGCVGWIVDILLIVAGKFTDKDGNPIVKTPKQKVE